MEKKTKRLKKDNETIYIKISTIINKLWKQPTIIEPLKCRSSHSLNASTAQSNMLLTNFWLVKELESRSTCPAICYP
jgi:hypothetical protein